MLSSPAVVLTSTTRVVSTTEPTFDSRTEGTASREVVTGAVEVRVGVPVFLNVGRDIDALVEDDAPYLLKVELRP